MKILRTKRKTKSMRAFGRTEWPLVHKEHFGHEQEKKYWEKVKFNLYAKEGKENRGRKIYLHTGVSWKAVDFYKKLGYQKTGLLKNHYEGQDFCVMSKLL